MRDGQVKDSLQPAVDVGERYIGTGFSVGFVDDDMAEQL